MFGVFLSRNLAFLFIFAKPFLTKPATHDRNDKTKESNFEQFHHLSNLITLKVSDRIIRYQITTTRLAKEDYPMGNDRKDEMHDLFRIGQGCPCEELGTYSRISYKNFLNVEGKLTCTDYYWANAGF